MNRSSLFALAALVPLASQNVVAQPAVAPPTARALNATTPVANATLSVLVVAVDPDARALSVRGNVATAPVAGSPPAITPALPGVDNSAPPPIQPANAFAPNVEWRVSAQRKRKPNPDDDFFKMEPEPPRAIFPNRKTPANPAAPVIQPNAPALPVAPLQTLPVARDSISKDAAAALSRALIKAGYTNALDTTLDGSSVVRVVNARRLSSRVGTQLRRAAFELSQALSQPAPQTIAAAPDAPAVPADAAPADVAPLASPVSEAVLKNATQAAARLGQAMGYRAVVLLSANASPDAKRVDYALLLTDALRETSEPIAFEGAGRDAGALEIAGATGAGLVSPRLGTFPRVSDAQKALAAEAYLTSARERIAARDLSSAQDLLNQVIALDPNAPDANRLLGDVLKSSDPAGAAQAYRRALEGNIASGDIWAQIAIAQTLGDRPDWPRAVEAGERALQLGFDSAELRLALANAQLARAQILNNAIPPRFERADQAEADATKHIDRAFSLDPANPEAVRLLARRMVADRRYAQAVRVLDRIATQYPDDAEVQAQYALALMGAGDREEDAFKAWARAWKLSGARENAQSDALTYTRLGEGFDRRLDSVGQSAARTSLAAGSGSLTREQALNLLTKLQEEMSDASDAIKSLEPPADTGFVAAQETRALAADLLVQSLKLHRVFLQTGQTAYQTRALEAHRQAITNLRLLRGAL